MSREFHENRNRLGSEDFVGMGFIAFSMLVIFLAAASVLSIRSDFLDGGHQEESQRMQQDEVNLRPWVERIHSLQELPQL